MENPGSLTPDRSADFRGGFARLESAGQARADKYVWIEKVLIDQRYVSLSREQRGGLRTMLAGAAGLSMPQITRLIRRYRQTGHIRVQDGTRRRFPARYTTEDLILLVDVDCAHQCLSGPATRRILQREWSVFGKQEFAHLAEISLAHLYNLRNSDEYRKRMAELFPKAESGLAIVPRRRLEPKGTPGYFRLTIADQPKSGSDKGICRIDAVDSATQWTVTGCARRIDHQSLLPALESMLLQAPFRVLGFHADNETELPDETVARLLNRLLAEYTRSLPNVGSDDTMAAGDNGITGHAARLQRFYTEHLNCYLNYHRPCGFGRIRVNERGRRCRRYGKEDYLTPYEKLRSLPQAERHLRGGVRWELLDRFAYAYSDTEAARRMLRAGAELLGACELEDPRGPGLASSYFSGSSYVPSRRIQMFR